MEPNKDNPLKHKQWHEDGANWKWGIFYFNPEDPRILPPKRIKQLGWTVNFARWQSWLFMSILILLFVFMINLA
jgi:uncharacterized membrane protein